MLVSRIFFAGASAAEYFCWCISAEYFRWCVCSWLIIIADMTRQDPGMERHKKKDNSHGGRFVIYINDIMYLYDVIFLDIIVLHNIISLIWVSKYWLLWLLWLDRQWRLSLQRTSWGDWVYMLMHVNCYDRYTRLTLLNAQKYVWSPRNPEQSLYLNENWSLRF